MKPELRKIQGPYGRSRRYILSLPRYYAEYLLRHGYENVLIIKVGAIALLVPAKGYEVNDILGRAIQNYSFLIDLEKALLKGRPLVLRLEEVLRRLEEYIETMRIHIQNQKLLVKPYYKNSEEVTFTNAEESALPSYLRNNPWLEILSKRGND